MTWWWLMAKEPKTKASPKDPEMLQAGNIQQLYRIAGKGAYKNPVTGHIYQSWEFDDIDFQWKNKPDEWKKAKGLEHLDTIQDGPTRPPKKPKKKAT